MEPRLVEESTFSNLVPTLEKVVKALKSDAGHHDLLVALSIVIMKEAGFRLDEISRVESGNFEVLEPDKWKSTANGCYEIKFKHDYKLLECKLVGIPVGDVLVVNLCPLRFSDNKITKTRCIALQTLKYVNPYSSDLAGRFMNLRELAHRFKDNLTMPIKGEVLTAAGIANASLIGLPTELKLKILGYLDATGISRLSEACRQFRNLLNLENHVEPRSESCR